MAWEGRRRGAAALAVAVLGIGALGACNDDKGPSITAPSGSGAPTTSESTSASSSASPVVVDGVTLTPQGSALHVGQTATVAYQPRQGQTGVLAIKVTALYRTTFKRSFVGWDLDPKNKKANPYFVAATITNKGQLDLGGRPAPLYIVDANNTLIEATTFASEFTPCTPGTFPKKFKTGKKTKVCLVYLAPKKGDLTAVSFRPTQDYDPITWTGKITKAPRKVLPTGSSAGSGG